MWQKLKKKTTTKQNKKRKKNGKEKLDSKHMGAVNWGLVASISKSII